MQTYSYTLILREKRSLKWFQWVKHDYFACFYLEIKQMYFLMTTDVENFSIPLNREDSDVAKQIYEVGLPRLLDLYARHDIKKGHGHEIGCHGYDHSPERAFDLLSYEEQVNELKKAKKVIEGVAGRIESFRAPMLRINEATVRALEETGFQSDSSIASQRFDGPFTFGSTKKLEWLIAPRKPYMLSHDSVVKSGDSNILESPISAAIIPFIGTTMRISPFITKLVQKCLYHESKRTDKPVVFLFHPNECLEIGDKILTTRRTNNPFEYLFADVIRHKLKMKNLGIKSLTLLDEVLRSAYVYGFEFVSVNEYRKLYEAIDYNFK